MNVETGGTRVYKGAVLKSRALLSNIHLATYLHN